MTLHFCISDTLQRFRLTADILHLNKILFCEPIMFFLFICTYIKCNIQISKIERLFCSVQGPWEKECLRYREKNLSGTKIFVQNQEIFYI